ncbi:MAG: CoA transferase [Deltaproteobacteria bacterium CG_4_8_14_3_um_filter_45_9]|nr:MAG: CoA transferase [Deltaproteobacteria bacterium CG03_land_8_20_14_0_80_45_14]PIX21318.1 MAG: CoA transferase [Deltaproteobacteria bacterium CG_4_8_14_3_um_filter_45_9]
MEDAQLLKNVTVLSLEQATVLPYLTLRLAEDGANIIRMEHPVYGDPNRRIGDDVLKEDRMFSYYLSINAGKKALTLDIGTPEGQEILKKLILKLKVDIFATNQLPRNYPKLGIEYKMLKKIKEDIIWLGMTGFGPQNNEAAYDPVLQARGGLMELTGEKGGSPQVMGIPLPDMGASEHGYGLLMKALYKRAVTGQGSRIDLSMFESTVSWLTQAITHTVTFKKKVSRRGNTHEFFAPVSVYETKNGYVYIAVGNDRQWETMTKIPGFESLYKKEYERNAGRIADVDSLNNVINAITKKITTAELIDIFNKATIAISKVNTIEEVVEDPLVKPNLIRSKDSKTGVEITIAPPPFNSPYLKSVNRMLSFPPRFGEHNEEIYSGLLGYGAAQLKGFKEKNII